MEACRHEVWGLSQSPSKYRETAFSPPRINVASRTPWAGTSTR